MPVVIKRDCPPCDCNEKGHDKSKRGRQPPESNALIRFTGLLALFTLLLVGVGAYQGWVLNLSLGAAKKAADAAKLSASHIQATERPWIVVQSDVDGPPIGWPEAGSFAPALGLPPRLTLPWKMANHGKTPAWITRAAIHIEVRSWPLPDRPFKVEPTPWNDWLITADKPHGHTSPVEVTQEQWPEHWRAILEQRECVVFYGLVEYRDVFGDLHRTRFCETWYAATPGRHHPVNFMPMGPTKEWTEYT